MITQYQCDHAIVYKSETVVICPTYLKTEIHCEIDVYKCSLK